ncbi:MAG: hypothetical protein NTX56_12110, partial [Proteobacteria bacterium]|nr:hypothetical protein [Pseudomonadota bacterium]
ALEIGSTPVTTKRYASDLRLEKNVHIIARRRDEEGLEISTYAYGKGKDARRLKPLNGKSKAAYLKALAEKYPLSTEIPMVPRPDSITAALMGI